MQALLLEYASEIVLSFVILILTAKYKDLTAKFERKEKREHAVEDGVKSILHYLLYRECKVCLDAQQVSTEELKEIEHIYDAYHTLGGNGTGTALYNRILSLPIENTYKED